MPEPVETITAAAAVRIASAVLSVYGENTQARRVLGALLRRIAELEPPGDLADQVGQLDDAVQLVAVHDAARDALIRRGIAKTDPSAVCAPAPAGVDRLGMRITAESNLGTHVRVTAELLPGRPGWRMAVHRDGVPTRRTDTGAESAQRIADSVLAVLSTELMIPNDDAPIPYQVAEVTR